MPRRVWPQMRLMAADGRSAGAIRWPEASIGKMGGLALPAVDLLEGLVLPIRATAEESEAAMMQVGLDVVYADSDPTASAAQFRKVLSGIRLTTGRRSSSRRR